MGSEQIFKRPADGTGKWQCIPGLLKHVSASGNGYIWGVNKNDAISINAENHALENGFTLAGRSSKQIDGGHISMCTVSTRIMICSLCEWTKHLAGDILLVRN